MSIDDVLSLDPDNMGLMVEMKGHNLRKAKPIDIRGVLPECLDSGHVCVRCVECGQMMVFTGFDALALDGWYQCHGCWKRVSQDRVYGSIERENEREEAYWDRY